jgi:hypothetical protein
MTFFMTFDLQHAMGGISRIDTFSITPQYPSVFRFWCLVRHVCAIYRISQNKWRPDILVLMLKNILYLANFCLHIETFETKVLEMVYSCANRLMTASWDFPLSLSRNCHWLTTTDSLCPVTHCTPSSPKSVISNTGFALLWHSWNITLSIWTVQTSVQSWPMSRLASSDYVHGP